MQNLLIVFLKKPELGKVKTRLAVGIGKQNSLLIYKNLVLKAINTFVGNWDVQLHWAYDIPDNYKNNSNSFIQTGTDIGEKMMNAINFGLVNYPKVILVGADIPRLNATVIGEAFKNLENSDLVLGPALDGGYYLIGTKKSYPDIFGLSKWSHEGVLNDTITIAKQLNISYSFTESLNDLDTKEDLAEFPELLELLT